MLTFLRKIRKSLVDTGSARKYLLYALGEIALVVIGILIALQVNLWSQNKQLHKQERIYLDRLYSDLSTMKTFYDNSLKESYNDSKNCMIALRSLESCTLKEDEKDIFQYVLANHQVLQSGISKSSAYDEMIASGAFARIDNDSIKIAVSDLYSGIEEFKDYINYFRQELAQASVVINKHVTFSFNDGFDMIVLYDFNRLCDNIEFRNAMVEVLDSRADRYGRLYFLCQLLDRSLEYFERTSSIQ